MDKLFKHNADTKKNAYLNWRMNADESNNFYMMGQAYFMAEKNLVDLILANNADKKADLLIFPILFLLNQGIELYCKCIMILLKKAKIKPEDYPTKHNLELLLTDILNHIDKEDMETHGIGAYLIELTDYISELFEMINFEDKERAMFFSRYPITKNKEPYFYVRNPITDSESIKKNPNIVIDVEELQRVSEAISSKLEGVIMMYQDQIDYQESAEAQD